MVLLLGENAGKTLGHYATAWGTLPLSLVVIDEVVVGVGDRIELGDTVLVVQSQPGS